MSSQLVLGQPLRGQRLHHRDGTGRLVGLREFQEDERRRRRIFFQVFPGHRGAGQLCRLRRVGLGACRVGLGAYRVGQGQDRQNRQHHDDSRCREAKTKCRPFLLFLFVASRLDAALQVLSGGLEAPGMTPRPLRCRTHLLLPSQEAVEVRVAQQRAFSLLLPPRVPDELDKSFARLPFLVDPALKLVPLTDEAFVRDLQAPLVRVRHLGVGEEMTSAAAESPDDRFDVLARRAAHQGDLGEARRPADPASARVGVAQALEDPRHELRIESDERFFGVLGQRSLERPNVLVVLQVELTGPGVPCRVAAGRVGERAGGPCGRRAR
jgi:hypothetical protein